MNYRKRTYCSRPLWRRRPGSVPVSCLSRARRPVCVRRARWSGPDVPPGLRCPSRPGPSWLPLAGSRLPAQQSQAATLPVSTSRMGAMNPGGSLSPASLRFVLAVVALVALNLACAATNGFYSRTAVLGALLALGAALAACVRRSDAPVRAPAWLGPTLLAGAALVLA